MGTFFLIINNHFFLTKREAACLQETPPLCHTLETHKNYYEVNGTLFVREILVFLLPNQAQ